MKGVIIGECPRSDGNLRALTVPGVRASACEDCSAMWVADGRLAELAALNDQKKPDLLLEIAADRRGWARRHKFCMLCPVCDMVLILMEAALTVSPWPMHVCSSCTANLLDLEAFEEVLRDTPLMETRVAYGVR